MTESQSRYGIMKELTDRKTAVIAEVANLEKGFDNTVFSVNIENQKRKDAISDKKQNYKSDFQSWKKSEELKISMKLNDNNREIEQLERAISDKEASYEEEAQAWIKQQEAGLAEQERGFVQWKKNSQAEIAAKKAVLKEIDEAIESLKEISKEQKEKT